MSIVPAIFLSPHATFPLSIAICSVASVSLLSLYSFLSPLSRARTWFLTLTFLQRSATRPLASRVALSRCRFHELESDQRDVLHFAEKNSFIYPQVHDSGLTVALASLAAILTINAYGPSLLGLGRSLHTSSFPQDLLSLYPPPLSPVISVLAVGHLATRTRSLGPLLTL